MSKLNLWHLVVVCALLVAHPVFADGDITAGQERSSSCVGCHGPNGEGVNGDWALAGQDQAVLESAMLAYKTGERTEQMMGMLMQGLSDEDIAALAAYYASLENSE